MRVELRIEARRDLLEAALFYDRQREGLGDQFTDSLFEDLERLEREAGVHEVVFGVHRKLSRRFPFAVYYRVEGSVVDVVAILDCRQEPGAIERRLARNGE